MHHSQATFKQEQRVKCENALAQQATVANGQ